jgi:hypothetical protein
MCWGRAPELDCEAMGSGLVTVERISRLCEEMEYSSHQHSSVFCFVFSTMYLLTIDKSFTIVGAAGGCSTGELSTVMVRLSHSATSSSVLSRKGL